MKKLNVLVAAALAALALAGGAAHAADSASLAVSATVIANCKITGAAPLAFGSLDPASSATVTATGSVTFWCTKGAGWALSANTGLNASGSQLRMKGPGATDFMNYTLTLASTSGTGAGVASPVTVSANGSIAASAFQNATMGAYSDTVTVSITP